MEQVESPSSAVRLTPTGLELTFPDGAAGYLNYYWLRDNCPTSFDPQTRERVFDIFAGETAPEPRDARIDGAHLEISWRDENHVSRYPLDWLAPYAAGKRRADPADLPRKAWYGGHFPDIARFSQPALCADKARAAAWIKALLVEGIAIVQDMPDSDAGLSDLVRVLGQLRPTFWGEYFDVKTHIAPTNLAYTAKALELHTDTPAEDAAPGVQFLHCRANTVAGGENLFLDGMAAANDLKVEHPEDFRLLCETEIPFYCEHDGFDMRARQRVIELDAQGEVSGVTISQHMADVFDLSQPFLDRYYPALRRFGRMLQSPKYLMRFRLKPGECIVFDNHRIVHGRAAYSATSGDRYYRGCYADRGEMRSTYRALVSSGRFK